MKAEPGKIAQRLMAWLHSGHVLVQKHGYQLPGNREEDRVVSAIPDSDRERVLLLDFEYPAELKDYSLEYLRELERGGWVVSVDEHIPYVFCLTPAGEEVCTRLFGVPEVPLFVRPLDGRMVLTDGMMAALDRLTSGEVDEAEFAGSLGIDVDCVGCALGYMAAAAPEWAEAIEAIGHRVGAAGQALS